LNVVYPSWQKNPIQFKVDIGVPISENVDPFKRYIKIKVRTKLSILVDLEQWIDVYVYEGTKNTF
jgi:hypothetical protein